MKAKMVFGLIVQLFGMIAIPLSGKVLESHVAVWACLILAGISGMCSKSDLGSAYQIQLLYRLLPIYRLYIL
jgi:hypothetical protein